MPPIPEGAHPSARFFALFVIFAVNYPDSSPPVVESF